MRKQNFLGLFGISVACFMVVGACYAATTSTLLYTFDVMKPTTWCPPSVTVEQGTESNGAPSTSCYRIITSPQIMGDNGCIIDSNGTSNASNWICNGTNGCPPSVTVEQGTESNGAPSTSCYRIITSPQIMGDNGCIIDPNGTSNASNWICNGADGASAYQTWLNQEGNSGKSEEDFLASLKGENGTACTTTVSRDAATGKTLIEATCGENTQSAEIDEDTIATGTVNKIKADNIIALKEDLTVYAKTADVNTELNKKLNTTDVNATFLADKLPDDVVKTGTLTTRLSGYATTEQLNGKLSASDINATFLADKLPANVVKTDGNDKIPSDKIPALTAAQMPSDYATIKADAAKGATALQSTDLSQALADAHVVMTTDNKLDNNLLVANGIITSDNIADNLPSDVLKDGALEGYAKTEALTGMLKAEDLTSNDLKNTIKSAVEGSGALSDYVTSATLENATKDALTADSLTDDAIKAAIMNVVVQNMGTCEKADNADTVTCTQGSLAAAMQAALAGSKTTE